VDDSSIAGVLEREVGPLEILVSPRDTWRVARGARGLITWPNPVIGDQHGPMTEILGQVIALRRIDHANPLTVVWPKPLGLGQANVLVQVPELNVVFAHASPTVEIWQLQPQGLSLFAASSRTEAVDPGPVPSELQAVVAEVFDGICVPDYAFYRGSVFSEYLGIPVVGMVGDTLTAGIDRRDQAMARESEMTRRELHLFARQVLQTLVASRTRRSGRYDFSRVAVGRLLRSLLQGEGRALGSLEFGEVGEGRARAYASDEDRLIGFGSALDLWLIVEMAAFAPLVGESSGVVYLLDQEPMTVFHELARLVGMPYSIEVKELTGG